MLCRLLFVLLFVLWFRMYDLKMSFIKFDGCNGPLDNVLYIPSYENRHLIFLCSAKSKEAKISSKRPWENQQHDKMLWNVFQPCQLYYLLRYCARWRRNKKEARHKEKEKGKIPGNICFLVAQLSRSKPKLKSYQVGVLKLLDQYRYYRERKCRENCEGL